MSSIYKLRDVVVTTHEYGKRKLVITEIVGNLYRATCVSTKKNYMVADEQIENVIDEVTNDFLSTTELINSESIKSFCLDQARLFPDEASKWNFLSTLNCGDSICLVHRNIRFEGAVFCGINPRKPIYPVRAKIKGRLHDFRLTALLPPSLRD